MSYGTRGQSRVPAFCCRTESVLLSSGTTRRQQAFNNSVPSSFASCELFHVLLHFQIYVFCFHCCKHFLNVSTFSNVPASASAPAPAPASHIPPEETERRRRRERRKKEIKEVAQQDDRCRDWPYVRDKKKVKKLRSATNK